MLTVISAGERLFIQRGVELDCRMDGRKLFEYRQLELEVEVLPNCHGSAHVRLGTTDLLVGVKAELTEPKPDEPNLGILEFGADFSANASPMFEGRGGDDLVDQLVTVLDKAITPAVDRAALCVVPGRNVWTLFIDILVLEFASMANLFDASAFGIKAALFDTK